LAKYGLKGYQPKLPDKYTVVDDGAADPSFKISAMTRAKFHSSIRTALEISVEKMAGRDPNNKAILFYRCGSCGLWGEGHSMHLGHKVNWKDYLASKKPLNEKSAILAYNDLRNLHFEHGVCNTSHAFENGAISDEGEAVQKFEELSKKYKVKSVPLGVNLELSSGYVLLLGSPTVGHKSVKAYGAGFSRPGWDKSTRAGLISIWQGSNWIKEGITPDGRKLDLYVCGSCGNWGEGFSMQLGHIENWGSYISNTAGLAKSATATIAEAQWAYNDLNNLIFEHPTCNAGHEWEEHDSSDKDFLPNKELGQKIQKHIKENPADKRAVFKSISGAVDVEWAKFVNTDDEAQKFDRETGRLIASAILIELQSAGDEALFDKVKGSIPLSQEVGSTGDHFSSEPVREKYVKSETMKSELVGLVLKALKLDPNEISLSKPLLAAMQKVNDPLNGLPKAIADRFHLEVDSQAPHGVGKPQFRGILGSKNSAVLNTDINSAESTAEKHTKDICELYQKKVIDAVVARFNTTWAEFIKQPLKATDLEKFKIALETPASQFKELVICGARLESETIKLSCAGFVKLAASAVGVSSSEDAIKWISTLPLIKT